MPKRSIAIKGFRSVLLYTFAWVILFSAWKVFQKSRRLEVTDDILEFCDKKNVKEMLNWTPPLWSGYQGSLNRSVKISYESAKTYRGPVIKGWEPHRNRNSSVYVRPKENTILLNPLSCRIMQKETLDMIIIQHSAPTNFKERLANRLSWMRFARFYRNIRIIFVVGIPTKSPEDIEHSNHEVQIKIEEEFAQFGDILQVESYESYSNNTLKSLLTLKFLLGTDWTRITLDGQPPKFIMRTDDDVFVNIPLINCLIIEETKWTASEGQHNWPPMIGAILINSPVVKIPEDKMNNTYAPRTFYECPTYFHDGANFYPSYMQGAGYFLPWWSIACLYQQSLKLPYFFIEDVFIGGWVADSCLLPKENMDGFTMFKPNIPISQLNIQKDLLVHYVDSDYKLDAYETMMSQYDYLEVNKQYLETPDEKICLINRKV